MAVIKWTRHYTGLEFAEKSFGPLDLYLSRERTRFMARLTLWRRMLGIFTGNINYGSDWGHGIEVFTNKWHLGFISKRHSWAGRKRVRWSGSIAEPYHAVTVRIGRFFLGRRTPGWLLRIKERRAQAAWEKECALYEKEFGIADQDEGNYVLPNHGE